MTAVIRIAGWGVAAIIIAAAMLSAPCAPEIAAALAADDNNHGMSRYADPKYGFTLWYPSALPVTAMAARDRRHFPGGVLVETLQVGPEGGVSVYVVNSPKHTITDEPDGHASPIPQTQYFFDTASKTWKVNYPEGTDTGAAGAPAAADVSKVTIGGLPMLPSGARFDTTIIPLSTTRFIVVQDGGGSSFTNELASTVAAAGASIDPAAQSKALQAEAAAFAKQ